MQQQNTFYRKVNVVRELLTTSIQATVSNLWQLYLLEKNLPFSFRNLLCTLSLHYRLIFNIEIKKPENKYIAEIESGKWLVSKIEKEQ